MDLCSPYLTQRLVRLEPHTLGISQGSLYRTIVSGLGSDCGVLAELREKTQGICGVEETLGKNADSI